MGRGGKEEKKEEKPELSLAEQMADMESQLAELPTLASKVEPPPPSPQSDSDALDEIYLKLFDCARPPKMKTAVVLDACESDVGLPGEGTTAERVTALKLLVP